MYAASFLITFLMAALALASPAYPLKGGHSGHSGHNGHHKSCSTPDGAGSCKSTSQCTSGFSVPGHCPGPTDIQCCVTASCTTSSGSGSCLNTSQKCSGNFVSGACPGSSSVECCVKGGSAPPSPPSSGSGSRTGSGSSSGSGSGIVTAAVGKTGLPYVYGGGGCDGPSDGGFDCSGLTQYAVCKALNKQIPRTAMEQYASSMGTRHPRSEAKPGDCLFWATGGDCESSVDHVGIYLTSEEMVNAAHTGTPVRKQAIWESSGGLSICPEVVRFW